MKRILLTITTLLTILFAGGSVLAQDSSSDIERRLKALEEKVAQMQKTSASPELDEVRRQIDVLTHEIESLKNNETKPVAQADTMTYGLGAAASKIYRAEPGVSFGGYGEFLYEKPNHGELAKANLERAVLYTGYKFNPRVLFNSELEVEGGSTERGGAVSVEFAYLDYLIRPELNVRAGLMLMPVGLINEQHEPTAYFGATRPRLEHDVIPATWGDFGGGVFGDVGRFSYRAYVTTGLDSATFDSEEGIREGRQAGASAIAEDFAAGGRVDFHPFEGTMFGGSLYTGNSGQGRGYSGRVTLGEVHADSKFRGLSLRGLFARAHVGDAAAINEANGYTGEESIGSSLGGWYVEGAYDLSSMIGRDEMSLAPYVRYETLDTQRRVPAGFERNPELDRNITTLGVAWKPITQTVLKVDWQRIHNRARSNRSQFNVALGYIF